MDYLLTANGNGIRHRALFQIADFAFSILNIFKGVVVAISRFGILVLFFGLGLMRSDFTLLPYEVAQVRPFFCGRVFLWGVSV